MRKLVGFSVVMLVGLIAGQATAQNTGLFSGNGIKNAWGGSNDSGSQAKSTPFGFHQGTRASDVVEKPGFKFPKIELPKIKAPKWEMPKLFQGREYPDSVQMSDSKGKGLFSSMPKFDLTSRDPGQPNFFQRMNERTKQLFGRTKNGISNSTNSVLGADRNFNWDSITKGNNGDIGGSGNRNQPPVQPNLRSARNAEKAVDRF